MNGKKIVILICVKGEPPPVFTWWKDGHQLKTDDRYLIQSIEYQGGATAILQIHKTRVGNRSLAFSTSGVRGPIIEEG